MQKSARTAAFVATANAEASRTFYEKTLGFRLIAEDPFALVFDANGTRLRIQKGQKGQSHTPVPYTVLGWQVPDIERAIKALVANGAVFERFSFFPQDALGIWN